MKQVVAYIKPNKLPCVTLALHRLQGLSGVSFSEISGFGQGRIPKTEPPVVQDLIDYAPYIRIEILCSDDQVSEVAWTIQGTAHSGHNGDGKVYVLDVCRAICIQTGDLEDLAA